VALLALIAGTVSYLHMHLLVELHGQPGWVAALTPLSVDGMIVAASATLLAESRSGRRGGMLPWALLVTSSSLMTANVAVAEATASGRVIAAWPSFALIASYGLLMRQVRRAAEAGTSRQRSGRVRSRPTGASSAGRPAVARPDAGERPGVRGREAQVLAWQWALANRSGDGSLPSGRDIGRVHCNYLRPMRAVRSVRRCTR
jgi:Protein of unknown function (DUF2637)